MKYSIFEVIDDGETAYGFQANNSTSYTSDDEIVDYDSKPIEGRGLMVMNTVQGDFLEIKNVTEILDEWETDSAENVLFTNGKACYHWKRISE